MSFAAMMALEQHGPDTFVGTGPGSPWGRLYGGQIVAQALRAAGLTVADGLHPHSLHAYFMRPGDQDEPIRFEVDRLRDGRSFVTRRVEARQSAGAILTMAASFQLDEQTLDRQVATMPWTPSPDELESTTWSGLFDRRFVPLPASEVGRAIGWLRLNDAVGNDRLLQACALAYVSDDLPMDAVVALHPEARYLGHEVYDAFHSASLDHAIWFHRPAPADAWQLHDFTCHGSTSSRGVSLGHVYAVDGSHVATVSQEALLRPRR